jgi:hypothetical protein
MSGIHFGQAVGGRKLEDLSANELRARLIRAGKDVPKDSERTPTYRGGRLLAG